jgi:hypothetical protein
MKRMGGSAPHPRVRGAKLEFLNPKLFLLSARPLHSPLLQRLLGMFMDK